MTAQKTAHNFPLPYPGECLYSLFSRYHARSGNASFQDTTEDLFGNPRCSFYSSVTTPYRLEFVQRWYPQDAESFAEKLLLYHTGFQYYCLICWPSRRKEYHEAFCQGTARDFRPATLMAREISCDFHHLRYCPMCADDEIERYGEPYWGVLPQIDGVDFCPVHGCRLCDSPVAKNDTRESLKPASQILTKGYLSQIHPVFAATDLDWECLAFSRDVWWLLNHGASLDSNTINQLISLNLHVNHMKSYRYPWYASKELIVHHASAALLEKMGNLYVTKIVHKEKKPLNNPYFYMYFLPTRVLTIHYLFGSVENAGKAALDCNNYNLN